MTKTPIYTLEVLQDVPTLKIYKFLEDNGDGEYFKGKKQIFKDVFRWNEFHSISYSRKSLREYGRRLLTELTICQEEYLEKLKEVKIKTVY